MKKVLFTIAALTVLSTGVFAQKVESRILAHRGGRYEFEENTMSAFKSAFKAGCTGFETDIRMTADDKLVIIHNSNTKAMTGTDGEIEQMLGSEVKALTTKKGGKIPFMEELMEFLNSHDNLYVEFEMKTDPTAYPQKRLEKYCDKVYKAVYSRKKPKNSLYVLSSFDTRALIYLKSKHPECELMLITGKPCSQEVIDYCNFLQIKRMACTLGNSSRAAVRKAHEQGMKVNLWPGSKPDDTVLAYYLEADYLCTDLPVEVMHYIKENKFDIKF